MKITIEIDEKEIQESVMNTVIYNAVKTVEHELYSDGYSANRRIYREEIKSAVREVIRKNIDNLSEKAVKAAAVTISNKALKSKLDALLEE